MVWFVGAGSGAVDLITVRGMKLLEQADVIIYAGSLVNPELLSYGKKGVQIHNSAHMTLEQVIDVIEDAEKQNFITVRLHTGDPSLYGAIKEQMDELNRFNIMYDIVPGVSSFCAAAAAVKAEYTLPNVSQTLIITRMEGRTPTPENEKISMLAKHRCSMAVFLSTGLLPQLEQQLLEGYDSQTPAAIVYKASWPDQKVFHCTVSTISETAVENNITKTALILVGDFLNSEYERSKLYDPEFSTEYRRIVENNKDAHQL